MKLRTPAVCCIALVLSLAPIQAARDGNWWRTLPREYKRCYAWGLIDGTFIFADEQHAILSIRTFDKIQGDQLVDGMDAFYNDFRNRSLPPGIAASCAAMAIKGAKSEEITDFIERARRGFGGVDFAPLEASPTPTPRVF